MSAIDRFDYTTKKIVAYSQLPRKTSLQLLIKLSCYSYSDILGYLETSTRFSSYTGKYGSERLAYNVELSI